MRSDEPENESMKARLRCYELIGQFDDETIRSAVAPMLERIAPSSAKPRKRGPQGERARTTTPGAEVEA
jgi:hypothetical protein